MPRRAKAAGSAARAAARRPAAARSRSATQGRGARASGARRSRMYEFCRRSEVSPGHSAEWWFVPVATGRVTDLRCGIRGKDGKTHAEHGMVGEIVIE